MEERRYMSADDFFRNSTPTTIVEDVQNAIREDKLRAIAFYETTTGKQAQAYSELRDKVI